MKPEKPERSKLPATRMSLTHRKECCGFKLYVTVTFFDDGANPNLDDAVSPCEVFCKIAKQGSVVAGLMDGVCGPVSIALQHGIHWDTVSKPLRHHTFEQKNDPNHTSLLDGLVQCVDRLIVDQCQRLGIDIPDGKHYKNQADCILMSRVGAGAGHAVNQMIANSLELGKVTPPTDDEARGSYPSDANGYPVNGHKGGNRTMISDGHIFYDDGSVWIIESKSWKGSGTESDLDTAPAKGNQ